MKRRFQVNGSVYEIPDDKVQAFLSSNPKATEVKNYNIEGSVYEIPLDKVDAFETAKGLKKKVGGQESENGAENSLPTSNAPQQTTSVDFNKLNALQGGSQAATPSQREMAEYGVHVQEATKEAQDKKIDEAADNSATLYFKNNPSLLRNYSLSSKKPSSDKFSLTQLRNASPYQQKVTELRTKVKDGELITATDNDGKIIVARPAGKWNTFKEGVSEAWNASSKADNYLKLSADDKIKFLQEHKPSEYLPEKADPESALYQGGSAVPIIGKTVTGSAAGALLAATIPETGGLTEPIAQTALPAIGAWMMTVPDMAKQSQMNAEIDAYHKIKAANPTMDDKEILKEAQKAGTVGYAEGLATGTAMNFIGSGLPQNTGQGLWKATGQFLRNQPKSISEIGTLTGATSAITEETKKALGVPITSAEEWDKMGKSMNSGAIMQLAFNVGHGLLAAPKYVKAQANQVLSNVNPEELQALQQKAVEAGFVTQPQVDKANESLTEYKEAQKKVIPTGNQEKDAVITGLVQKKANLEKLKSETDKSYHDEIDAQIENADQRIQLAKQTNDPIKYAEQDDLDGTKNFNPKPFDELSKKEVEGIATEIPKEYGDAEVEEVGGGEGSERKYKANPTVNRQQGFIKIKDKVSVEDKVYNDKADAEAASQKALAQHYYEHGMDETLKPEKKSNVTVILPKENNAPNEIEKVKVASEQRDAGSNQSDEPIHAEESGNTETTIPETTSTTGTEQTISQQENIGGQNAIPIGSAKEIPLGETSSNSEAVGRGISESKELTQAQDRATQESSNGEIPPTNGEGKVGIHVEHPETRVTYRGLQETATEFGLPDITKREHKSDIKLRKEADDAIREGFDADGMVDDILNGKTKVISDVDKVVLGQRLANLKDKARSIKNKLSPEYDKVFKEIEKYKNAGKIIQGELGAALRDPTFGSKPDDSLEAFLIQKKEANDGADLTDMQKEKTIKLHEEYEAKLQKEEALRIEAERKYNDLLAQKELNSTKSKTVSSSKKKTKEDYIAERAKFKDELKAAKEEHEKWLKENNIHTAGISGITLTPKMVKAISKIVNSHVQEVGSNLIEVSKKVLNDVKEFFDGITEEDIRNVIAGVYNEPQKTRTQLQVDLNDLKTEAKLINKLEEVKAGVPKTETQKRDKNARIASLQKELSELRKETGYDDETKLKSIKARNEAQTKKIEEKIANKEYDVEEKRSFIDNPEFKQKYPKLYKDVLDGIVAREDAKHRLALDIYLDQQAKRTKGQKAVDLISSAIATSKALVSGIDDSFVLMQNYYAMLANPITGAKAFKEHVLDTFSEKRFNRQLAALHNSKMWDTIQKSELEVLEPQSLIGSKIEEAFDNNLLNKTIRLKDGKEYDLKKVNFLRPFERAFTSMGNNMRVKLFLDRVSTLQDNGKTFESHPQEYKDAARVINELTGRGKQNKYVELANPAVTPFVWSPRLISSGLNMLGVSDLVGALGGKKVGTEGFYRKLTPAQRNYAFSQISRGVGMAISMMGALALTGKQGLGLTDNEVDFNPLSVTFGTVKIGNKSINIFGRLSPYVKAVVQFAANQRMKDGATEHFGEKYGGKTRFGVLGSLLRGKTTPFAGYVFDLSQGENFYTREKMSVTDFPKDLIVPMGFRDVAKNLDRDGSLALLYFLLSLEGLQISDQRDFPQHDATKKGSHGASHTVSHGHQ